MTSLWQSLYGRISLVYLVLSLILGLLCAWVTVRHFDVFVNAVDQKLNRNLASKLVPQVQSASADTSYAGALQQVTEQVTMLHPALELYVLDASGRVRAASPSPDRLARQRVDLVPVRGYLDGEAVPVWGDDPAAPEGKKVFSAASMKLADGSSGYLYVILSGRAARTAKSMLQNTYVQRTLLLSLLLALGFTVIVGLLLFRVLTRRFNDLATTVQGFKEGHYDERVEVGQDDEIGQLGRTFNEMADTIAAQMEALRRTDEERRQLVAQVSHDFRTPLTSIRGHAEQMLSDRDDLSAKDREDRLRMIVQNAERLDRLADQLHELSRLDAHQTTPNFESFSIAELVQDLVVKFQPQADEEDVALRAGVSPDVPSVYGDIGLVERLLSNLIDNALTNTPTGGTVTVRLDETNGKVRVQVEDTGVGIPEDELALVTQRFYRVDRDGEAPDDGSGLGLAIAAEIADAHGTDLAIDSELGEGTTVTVRFPQNGRSTVEATA